MLPKIFNVFQKKDYKFKVDKHRVFAFWKEPSIQKTDSEWEEYGRYLQNAIKQSVEPNVWSLISKPGFYDDPEYGIYVKKVRIMLIEEYGLDSEEVKIGNYHLGLLVLGFPAQENIKYPLYYRGVQLKPYEKV